MVVAIGHFDGVHRGHRRLVDEARRRAAGAGVATGVITFDRHPAALLSPANEPPALTGLEEKASLLSDCGVDVVVALPLSGPLLRTGPAAFVDAVLGDTLQVHSVVVGSNFRFGHRASGDPALLKKLAGPHGIDVLAMDLLDRGGGPVSSTRIRAEISAGRVRSAADLLGRCHRVDAAIAVHERDVVAARLSAAVVWPAPGTYVVSIDDLTRLNRPKQITLATIGATGSVSIAAGRGLDRPPVDGSVRLSFLDTAQ
jgi:riboflavin kinase / FMN adenylyltransferase